MEDKELLTLAGRLNLPEAVLAPLAAAAKALPEGLPIKQLTEPEAAAADWKTITAQLPVWQEDNGMAQLAVMLAATCRTEERYRRRTSRRRYFCPPWTASGAFWRRPTPAPGSGPLTGDFGHGGRLAGCCSGWGRWNLNIGGCGQGLSQRE